jgi:DNA-binding PadR family transcriptional regulator
MFFQHEGLRGHFRHGGRRFRGEHAHGGFGRERGSIKYDVLAVLWDGPRHGYDIMLEIERRAGTRPSPGSIYPALQMLEDADYVRGREVDGKRIYTITDQGSEYLSAYRSSPEGQRADAPMGEGLSMMLRGMRTLHGLRDAVKQIARSGDPIMIESAVGILERTRGELYALLAERG